MSCNKYSFLGGIFLTIKIRSLEYFPIFNWFSQSYDYMNTYQSEKQSKQYNQKHINYLNEQLQFAFVVMFLYWHTVENNDL